MIEKSNLQPEVVLYNEVSKLIEQGHSRVLSQANSTMTLLFWQVGKRINDFILDHRRAEYGKQIVVTLSRQLEERFGRNFEEKNLRRMLQFADVFPDQEMVVTLSRYLSWSHFLVLIPLKSIEKINFYAQRVIEEQLGVRVPLSPPF